MTVEVTANFEGAAEYFAVVAAKLVGLLGFHWGLLEGAKMEVGVKLGGQSPYCCCPYLAEKAA